MLHLHRKTEKGLFERACHLAIAEQQLSYSFLKKVIANLNSFSMPFSLLLGGNAPKKISCFLGGDAPN